MPAVSKTAGRGFESCRPCQFLDTNSAHDGRGRCATGVQLQTDCKREPPASPDPDQGANRQTAEGNLFLLRRVLDEKPYV